MPSPLVVSQSVMAAVNATGSASRVTRGMPAAETDTASSSRPMVVAVSKPRPKRNPMTKMSRGERTRRSGARRRRVTRPVGSSAGPGRRTADARRSRSAETPLYTPSSSR